MVSRFFLSEDGFKVQFNWPAVCDARSTVETTYDGRTDSTCAVDHGRWCAQTRLYYSTVIRKKSNKNVCFPCVTRAKFFFICMEY